MQLCNYDALSYNWYITYILKLNVIYNAKISSVLATVLKASSPRITFESNFGTVYEVSIYSMEFLVVMQISGTSSCTNMQIIHISESTSTQVIFELDFVENQ